MLRCHVRFHTFPTQSTLAFHSLLVAVLHVQARCPVASTPGHPRVLLPSPFFLPPFYHDSSPFVRSLCSPTRFLSFHLGWRGFVHRVWFVRVVQLWFSYVRGGNREGSGLGFSSNPVRGSLGDVSHDVSRVSQPSGVRVRRWGNRRSKGSGARENGVSRVALPNSTKIGTKPSCPGHSAFFLIATVSTD